jgi:hypothetical protein
MSMLSYCPKINQSRPVMNATFVMILGKSYMLAAGNDSTLAQEQIGILLIL